MTLFVSLAFALGGVVAAPSRSMPKTSPRLAASRVRRRPEGWVEPPRVLAVAAEIRSL